MKLGPVNLTNARRLTHDDLRVSFVMAMNINRRQWWSRILGTRRINAGTAGSDDVRRQRHSVIHLFRLHVQLDADGPFHHVPAAVSGRLAGDRG